MFETCIKWAQTECHRRGIDDKKGENIRIVLDAAFYNIRFGSMTVEEFANIHSAHPDLFLANELHELLYKFGNVKNMESSLFSKNPRFLTSSRCKIVGYCSANIIYSLGSESIEFKCNKAIYLNVFVLNFYPLNDVTICISYRNTVKTLLKKVRKVNEESEIVFDKPVSFLAGQSCTIKILFPSRYFNSVGNILLNKIEQNGVCFEIKSDCNQPTHLSHLLFDSLKSR